ncbi:MAG: tetratricopeptide repeat protein [bacterium]
MPKPLSLGLILLLAVACQKRILVEADHYERNGELDKSELALTRHLETHLDDHAARFQLGELRGRMGQYAQMLSDFAALEKKDGRWRDKIENRKEFYWRENFNRGVEALKRTEARQAITPLRNATAIFPERHAAYPALAAAILATPDSSGAQAALEKACALSENDLESRHALQQLYYNTGRYQEALKVSDEILQKTSDDLSALRCRALALQQLQSAETEEAFKALLRQSVEADDWLAFAMYYYRRQQHEYALLLFEQVLKSRDLDSGANDGASPSGARNHRTIRLGSQSSMPSEELYRYLGDCAWHLGDYAGMSQWYTRIIEARPGDISALQNLLLAAQALGKLDEAERIKKELDQLASGQE